jgi:hypothetical protein
MVFSVFLVRIILGKIQTKFLEHKRVMNSSWFTPFGIRRVFYEGHPQTARIGHMNNLHLRTHISKGSLREMKRFTDLHYPIKGQNNWAWGHFPTTNLVSKAMNSRTFVPPIKKSYELGVCFIG